MCARVPGDTDSDVSDEEVSDGQRGAARRRRVRRLQKYVVNPPLKLAALLGLAPGHALIETTGRRTGRRRRTVVGVHLTGRADTGGGAEAPEHPETEETAQTAESPEPTETAWIVSEQGRHSGYVANLTADPRVRLRLGRTWRTGRARVLPEDDPQRRLDGFGRPSHAAAVRRFGTSLLTVRVDLSR